MILQVHSEKCGYRHSTITCITGTTDGMLKNNCHSYRCDFGYFSDRLPHPSSNARLPRHETRPHQLNTGHCNALYLTQVLKWLSMIYHRFTINRSFDDIPNTVIILT